jgi:hypothetical protein
MIAILLRVSVFWPFIMSVASWTANENLTPKHNINLASYKKIKIGMTERDVETILGVPYGQYFRGKAIVALPPLGVRKSPVLLTASKLDKEVTCPTRLMNGKIVAQDKGWIANDMSIWIWVDSRGIVMEKARQPVWIVEETSLEVAIRWIAEAGGILGFPSLGEK